MRYENYDFEDDYGVSFVGPLITYGLILAAIFKLLRADRYARAVPFAFVILVILAMYIGTAFVLTFGILSLIGAGAILSSVMSTVVALGVGKYFLMPHILERYGSVENMFLKLRKYFTDSPHKFYKYDVQYQFNLFLKELEYKFVYVLGAGVFLLFLFFLCRDYKFLNQAYYIFDYQMGWWKYLILLGAWIACLFAYSKYYDLTTNLVFENLIKALAASERLKKNSVIIYDPSSSDHFSSITSDEPWCITDSTDPKLSIFVETRDGATRGCHIASTLPQTHFRFIISHLETYRGVAGFMDWVIGRKK